jgi:hypothetical protein
MKSEIPGAYHSGSRELQDHFDSRRIAHRLEEVNTHNVFTEGDRAFISAASMFFLATANEEGWPECSYKGGLPGFVRITGAGSLAFPLRRQRNVPKPGQRHHQPACRAAVHQFRATFADCG